jgi:Fe-S oxidoreductase
MDDVSLLRFPPAGAPRPYRTIELKPFLDWSPWNVQNDAVTEATSPPGTGGDNTGGFAKAVEMCNNNGHCRKFDAGTMCPSYRVTRDEQHLTRGRANTLRLALSGQLGTDAFTGEEMLATMDLCVGCKGCRRDCPTGVDMARMKIEFLHQRHERYGTTTREKLTAYLPRYARWASRLAPLVNLRNRVPLLATLTERFTGLSARRKLPAWRRDYYRASPRNGGDRGQVVLLVDCFSRYFEPENARATRAVLEAGGYDVIEPDTLRPLCCGRTFLSAGLVGQAREEMSRMLAAVGPYAQRGTPIVGIEPSCLLTLRDELKALLRGEVADAVAGQAILLEEFLSRESRAGRLRLSFRELGPREAFLHGHCHQKAFGAMPDVVAALKLIPGLSVNPIESSCCGMAGSFGYEAEHRDISMRMAELSLLPAIRKAPPEALIVADGTSCRHQIADGTARTAVHVSRLLEAALAPPTL